jgi:hypothetical protein
MKTRLIWPVVTLMAFSVGWLAGSVVPLLLWPGSECHRLGGAIHALPGSGKPTECVIPWDDH